MATNDLRIYDETNKILVTVPGAFAQRPESVLAWVWRRGIEVGEEVDAGIEVADIQWDNNQREAVTAPANCSGKIKAVNRDILYENLPDAPPQNLLALE
jgi:hypothetical protein